MTHYRDQTLARNREIVRLRVEEKLTYRAIGERHKIGAERVRQILKKEEYDKRTELMILPGSLVSLLRAGLLVVIGHPAADLEEASITLPKPPEAFTEPLMRIDAYRSLLDLIEWAEPSSPEPPVKVWLHDHRWALTTALDYRLKIKCDFAAEHENAAERRAKTEDQAGLIEEFLARLKE